MVVSGYIPPDEKWEKMKKVWEACQEADVDVPEQVREFFDGVWPEAMGREVYLREDVVKSYNTDFGNGFEVEVGKIPSNIKFIRFCCRFQ